jgi:hypothetical protein
MVAARIAPHLVGRGRGELEAAAGVRREVVAQLGEGAARARGLAELQALALEERARPPEQGAAGAWGRHLPEWSQR